MRYFIIFYISVHPNNSTTTGNISYSCTGYVNRASAIAWINNDNKASQSTITNIIELDKDDWDYYFEGDS